LDLFVAGGWTDQGQPGKNLLYHNDGNTNNWLEVKLVGTVSNRAAIGAKVRARATIAGKSFWQLREINQGGGHCSLPLIAHFGLGDATNVEVLRIEWPSGATQELHSVSAKQILTLIEPPRLLAGTLNGAPQFSVKGGRGFRYNIEVSEGLQNWTPLGTVAISNLSGIGIITDTNATTLARFYRAIQVGQ
jgi:hypothetical protein